MNFKQRVKGYLQKLPCVIFAALWGALFGIYRAKHQGQLPWPEELIGFLLPLLVIFVFASLGMTANYAKGWLRQKHLGQKHLGRRKT